MINSFPLKLWFVRALLLVSVLFGLQIFPITGIFIMFLMAVCGSYLWGLIPHLVTLGFLYDIKTRQLPRILIALPLIVYAPYYFYYMKETSAIKTVEAQFRSQNPHQIMKYDPFQHSLVLKDAEKFVEENKVPVAYAENPNFVEGYLSYRLIPRSKCDELKSAHIEREILFNISWRVGRNFMEASQQCVPEIPAKPDKNILRVTVDEQRPEIKEARVKKWGANFTFAGLPETSGKIAETDYNFEYLGRSIGVFKTATIERMPVFPFFIFGCGLNDAGPSWECGAMVYRHSQTIDTFPDAALRDAYGADPVRAMLQIEHYTDVDFSDFKGFPESITYINSMIARKKNETSADFNEWGMKKDSPYLPVISTFNGVPSYSGRIYARKEGRAFYAFIEGNHGKVVYIDATVDGNANTNGSGIGIYGVCPDEQSCMYNHYYDFKSSNGSIYEINKTMKRTSDTVEIIRTVQIKGYWSVGNTLPEGQNTRTILIGVAAPSGESKP